MLRFSLVGKLKHDSLQLNIAILRTTQKLTTYKNVKCLFAAMLLLIPDTLPSPGGATKNRGSLAGRSRVAATRAGR